MARLIQRHPHCGFAEYQKQNDIVGSLAEIGLYDAQLRRQQS